MYAIHSTFSLYMFSYSISPPRRSLPFDHYLAFLPTYPNVLISKATAAPVRRINPSKIFSALLLISSVNTITPLYTASSAKETDEQLLIAHVLRFSETTCKHLIIRLYYLHIIKHRSLCKALDTV